MAGAAEAGLRGAIHFEQLLNRLISFVIVTLMLASGLLGQPSGALPTADLLRAKGDLPGASQLYAAEAARLRGGKDRPQHARILQDWGETELAAGLYPDAARHGLQCAEAWAALPGFEERQISCLTITGRAHVYAGEYAAASGVLDQAVRLAHDRALGQSEVAALNDAGSARYYIGDYSAAHAAFSNALALVDHHPGEPWYPRLHQISLANLAMLQQRLGQYERALVIYRQLEAGSQSLQPSERARLLANIGALYRRLGDPYKAIEQYQAADRLFAQQRDHDGEIGVTTNTGIVLAMDLGDLRGAVRAFEKSFALAARSGNRREQAEAKLYASEALRRLGQYDEATRNAEQALTLANELKAPEEQWKAELSLAKIRETFGDYAGALTRYRHVIGTVEKLRQGIAGFALRAAFLGDKAEAYDGAIRMLLRDPAPNLAELFRYMEEGKARTLRDRLSGTAAHALVVTLPQLQQRLEARTALVEYWKSGDETAALFITARTVSVVRTGPIRDSSIDRMLEEIRSGGQHWPDLARELGAALVAGLPARQMNIERLLIVPDRQLQSVPFDVLMRPGSGRLLIDDYEISYIPAASMVRPDPSSRGWLLPWRRMLVAFADPAPPQRVRGDALFGQELAPLPGSREEIRGVAQQIGGRAELHAGEDNRKVYISSAHLAGVPILHFATHAITDPDDADRSRLALSGAGPGQPLAYLFAREIYGLQLTGVVLTTLAACDTEAGKVVAGEGAAALSRAFLSAGALATVSTLWRIGDQSSSQFMHRFYGGLAQGENAGHALRMAKLEFRNSAAGLAHPRHWAAFVLNGNAGVLTPRTFAPWTVLFAIALALAITVGIIRRRRSRVSV